MSARIPMKRYFFGIFCFMLVVRAGSAQANETIPFKGAIDLARQILNLEISVPQQDPLRLEVSRLSETEYLVSAAVRNRHFLFMEGAGIVTGSLKVQRDEKDRPFVTAALTSQGAQLNQIPVPDGRANLVWRGSVIDVQSLRWGPFACSGRLMLSEVLQIDLQIRFSGLQLQDIVRFLNQASLLETGGLLDGEIRLKGTPRQLQMHGRIMARNGFVEDHKYTTAEISFNGVYPRLLIDDSHIAQTDGLTFALEGSLDLSDLDHLEMQLSGFTKSALINESTQELEWTLKRTQSTQDGVTTEFKYMLDKQGGGEGGMIGVERKIEF